MARDTLVCLRCEIDVIYRTTAQTTKSSETITTEIQTK